MEKAFDRIEWSFLIKVLRRFGFTDDFIDLIDACVRENHFSLLVNGSSTPFFTATRGLRQGDLLSPTLFILVEEVLSRSLTRAINQGLIRPYYSKRGCPIISHSLFADDAILFLNGCETSIRGLMSIISRYERAAGQLVNASKSSFTVGPSTPIGTIRRIQGLTRFSRGHLPFDYLGCPIFLGRRRIHYFDALVGKLRKKLVGWKLQLLSPGGRIQLIRHVLMSMPLHLLAVHEVPDTILQTIRRICTSFLWDGQLEGPRRQRRVSWEKACRPTDEGGLGIRRPQDVLNMLQKKLVWRMRTTPSVLGSFVLAKYGEWARQPTDIKGVKRWVDCQRHWLEMVPLIRWRVGRGAISAWYDTWLEDTPLACFTTFTSS
ncbi:unnamed protein product [Spirodela intermedia]|uniref:Reverse transcriptase domain-containing protein n=1 Tax=Spirodela intermedia TaxID=51605 RepID=A0A7I8KHH3_SPIIN|nr:unnamed protein product [Spirodela intermedia]